MGEPRQPAATVDSTGADSHQAALDDDQQQAEAQVRAAERAHWEGDPAAGPVNEWPDPDSPSNPVAPGSVEGGDDRRERRRDR